MKIIKYSYNGTQSHGVLQDTKVKKIANSIFDDEYHYENLEIDVSNVKLELPISPTKIIALGHNYKDLVGPKDHYPEPVIFLKPPSAIIGDAKTIVISDNRKTWIEVELAVVIKKECKNITPEEAKDCILGVMIANDVTTQNVENRDHHLARSKGWDTFCPIGNIVHTQVDTSSLRMTSKINKDVTQNSTTANRILNDIESVSFVSKFFTLQPGDIILTGTPANAENSLVNDGDQVELEIENLGKLSNSVKAM